MRERDQMTTANTLNVLAGIWLVIAPFILNYTQDVPRNNDIIIGIAVAGLATVRAFAGRTWTWLNWVIGLLGAWLIVAPFILNYATQTPIYNDVILGVIVLAMVAWDRTASYISSGGHARA